ncbi:unnamed protein product, partial [Polarella glacialis]
TAYVSEAVQQLDSDDSDDDGKEGDDKAAGSKAANRDGAVNAGMVEESSIVQFHPNVDIVESANTEGLQDLRRVKGRMQTAYVSEAVQQLDSDDSDDDGKEGDDKAAGSKGANRDGAVNAGMVEESSIVQFHPNVDIVESANTEGLQDLRRVKGRMQTAYVSEAVQQLDSDDSDDDGKEGDDKAAGSKGANRDGAVNAGMVEESSIVQFHPNVDVVESANTEGWQDLRRVKGRMQTAYVSEAVQQLDSEDSDDDCKEGDDIAAGSKGANRDVAVNAGMVEEPSTVNFDIDANVDVDELTNGEGLQNSRRVKGRMQTAYVSEAVQQLDADDSDDDGNDKAAGSKGANRDGAVNAGMVEESSTVEFHANVGVVESANTDGLQDLHSAKWSTQNGCVFQALQQLDADDSDKCEEDWGAKSERKALDGTTVASEAVLEKVGSVQFSPSVTMVESENTEGLQDLRSAKGRVSTGLIFRPVQQLDENDSDDDDDDDSNDEAAGSEGANRDSAINAGGAVLEKVGSVQFSPSVTLVESANTEGLQDLKSVEGRVSTGFIFWPVQQLDENDSCADGNDEAAESVGARAGTEVEIKAAASGAALQSQVTKVSEKRVSEPSVPPAPEVNAQLATAERLLERMQRGLDLDEDHTQQRTPATNDQSYSEFSDDKTHRNAARLLDRMQVDEVSPERHREPEKGEAVVSAFLSGLVQVGAAGSFAEWNASSAPGSPGCERVGRSVGEPQTSDTQPKSVVELQKAAVAAKPQMADKS